MEKSSPDKRRQKSIASVLLGKAHGKFDRFALVDFEKDMNTLKRVMGLISQANDQSLSKDGIHIYILTPSRPECQVSI